MIEIHDRGGYLVGECPGGCIGRIIGSDGETPTAAIDIAVNIGDLIAHVRTCPAGKSATDQLLDKLIRERYGLSARLVDLPKGNPR